MPGKGITSKDYPEPLRKPGEKVESSTAEDAKDGAQKSASATRNETEQGKPSCDEASDLQVEETQSSQLAEEKPADELSSNQNESVEKDAVDQNSESVNTGVSEGTEIDVEGTSFTETEDLNGAETQQETAVKDEVSETHPVDRTVKLSPFAAEFVPKASSSFSLESTVDAPEFVPGSFPLEVERPVLLRQRSNKAENELMNCVKDVLFGLTQSPGELPDHVMTLVKMLRKWLSSLDSLKDVVDLIFEYSITKPNFQYIAAKVCDMLSKEQTIVLQNGEKFRSVFMTRCMDEHHKKNTTLENPDTSKRLFGFAMFEAELFCHYRPLGETEPLKVFHRVLLEMLNTLLQNPTEDCLTCIGNMLKMTGYLLDDPRFMKDEQDRKKKVDMVFLDVEKLSQGTDLSDSVKSLLSQVIRLRAGKWDSETTDNPSGGNTAYPADDAWNDFADDYTLSLDELGLDDDLTPVTNPEQWSEYYDDEDELALIRDTHKYYFPDQDNEGYSPEVDVGYYVEDDPEFDDEIDEEFEKFLQEQEDLQ